MPPPCAEAGGSLWRGLGLNPVLADMDWGPFADPMPVQRATIPAAARGENVVGWALGGSGKTVAFVVAALNAVDVRDPRPQVVIATGASSLTVQIAGVAAEIAEKYNEALKAAGHPAVETGLHASAGRGGKWAPPSKQVSVMTTGKLVNDLGKPEWTSGLRMIVIDEADAFLKGNDGLELFTAMAKLGVTAPGYRAAGARAATPVQVLLFSATFRCVDKGRPEAQPRVSLERYLALSNTAWELPAHELGAQPGARPVHSVKLRRVPGLGLRPYTAASALADAAAVAGKAVVRVVGILRDDGEFFHASTSDVPISAAPTCGALERLSGMDTDNTRHWVFKSFDKSAFWGEPDAADVHAPGTPLSEVAGAVVYISYCPK
jgi:hypothetical protein